MKLRWLLFLALLGCAAAGSPSMFGEITSPNYPQVYPNNVVKTWNIQVPEGYGIRLYFTHLDIEPSENCKNDSLQVLIGDDVQKRFCGRHVLGSTGFPQEKFYPTSHMKLSFTSDFSNQRGYSGFAAHYVATDVDECSSYAPCSHFCHNYIGGVLCSCPLEHQLQEDQKSCGVISCSTDMFRHAIINPQKDKYVFKDIITVKCKEGYQMGSSEKLPSFRAKCQGDGTWSSTHLKCELVNCGNPMKIVNGEVNFTHTTYGAKAVYNCKTEYYTLKGDDIYYCSVSGIWINSNKKSDLPECSAASFTCPEDCVWKDKNEGELLPISVCGQPQNPVAGLSRIINGKEAEIGNFPWQAFLKSPGRAGGVLIDEKWVLTAAHVLKPEGSTRALDINNLHMFLGDVDVDNLVKNGLAKVKAFHIYPDYTTESHDHDIALIELENPVTMDSNVSPICLPENSEVSLYESGRVGYVSGFGITEENKITDRLRYVILPVAARDKCQQQLVRKQKNRKFTENMFCAGFSEDENLPIDTCQGDSGGVFAVKNNEKWVATGLVSWGTDCGRGYGYYTKVVNYIDWIKSHIGR